MQTSPPAKKSFGYRSSSSVTSVAERTGDYESMYDKIKRRQHKETTETKHKRSSSSTSTSSDASVTPLIRSSFKASKKMRRKKEGRVKMGKRSRKRGIGCFASSEEEEETLGKRKKAPPYQDVSMVDSFKSSMKEVSQRLVSHHAFDEGLNDSYDEFDRYSVSTPSTEAMEQDRGGSPRRHSLSSSSSRWDDESIEQKSQKTFDDEIWHSSSGNEDTKPREKQSPRNCPQNEEEEDEDAYSPMRSMLGVSIPCVQLKSPTLSSTGSLVGGKFNSSTSSQHELSSLLLMQDKAPVDAPKSENPSKSPSVSSPSPAASIGALNCSKWGPDLSSSSRSQLSFETKPPLDDLNSEFERWRSKQTLPPGVNCATPILSPKPPPPPPPPAVAITVEKPLKQLVKTKPSRGGYRWSRSLDATEEGAKIGDVKNYKMEKLVAKPRSSTRAGDPYEPDFDEEVKVKMEQQQQQQQQQQQPTADNVQRVIDDVAAGIFDAQAYIDSWFQVPRTSTPVTSTPVQQQPPPPAPAPLVQTAPPPTTTTTTNNNNIISAIVSALNPSTASVSTAQTPVVVQVPKPTFSATTITLPAQTAAKYMLQGAAFTGSSSDGPTFSYINK
ncbi:hypothetical protein Ciccas_008791 [Cichlidogyrus casuarinus]|uniref:Uncharacterized protein n=1 Tax=Cichlidogyrus casuarinus TaxID=1844966 RepID=A0ABD2PZ08_9PLAT